MQRDGRGSYFIGRISHREKLKPRIPMNDMDLIYRCLGIILESPAFSSGQLDADHSTALPNVSGGNEE